MLPTVGADAAYEHLALVSRQVGKRALNQLAVLPIEVIDVINLDEVGAPTQRATSNDGNFLVIDFHLMTPFLCLSGIIIADGLGFVKCFF